jgi:hypothetical protein
MLVVKGDFWVESVDVRELTLTSGSGGPRPCTPRRLIGSGWMPQKMMWCLRKT